MLEFPRLKFPFQNLKILSFWEMASHNINVPLLPHFALFFLHFSVHIFPHKQTPSTKSFDPSPCPVRPQNNPTQAGTRTNSHLGRNSNKFSTRLELKQIPTQARIQTNSHPGWNSNKFPLRPELKEIPTQAGTRTNSHSGWKSKKFPPRLELEQIPTQAGTQRNSHPGWRRFFSLLPEESFIFCTLSASRWNWKVKQIYILAVVISKPIWSSSL